MEHSWHLPAYIGTLLERRDMSQRELARRCELSLGTIQELMGGARCSPKNMALMHGKLAETEAERYALICAHLRDEVVRFEADPTHVVIRHVEGADISTLDLTPEMNAYIGTLAREAEGDDGVASIIEALSGVLAERQALRADLAAAEAAKVVQFPGNSPQQSDAVAEPQMPYDAKPAKKRGSAENGRAGATPPVPKPPATA